MTTQFLAIIIIILLLLLIISIYRLIDKITVHLMNIERWLDYIRYDVADVNQSIEEFRELFQKSTTNKIKK